MKAFRFTTGTRIEPFEEPVGDAFVGGQFLEEAVAGAFSAAGIEVVEASSSSDLPPDGEYLVFPDTLFLTRHTVRRFLEESTPTGGPARLAMTRSAATEYCRPLQEVDEDSLSVSYDLFRIGRSHGQIPGNTDWAGLREFLGQDAKTTCLKPGEDTEPVPQSRPGPPRKILELPRTLTMAADVRHWAHLVWINHQLPWVRLEEYWEDHPGLKRAWRSRGSNPYRRAARRSIIGKGCDIHPTAWVEGSILGNGVKMGPFTSVRDSIIGDKVEISDHTKFFRSVVGEKCHTLNDSYFHGCTFYAGSTLASFMIRNSILGRRVFITSGVMFWDEALEKPVSVKHGSREVDTGRWLLGGAAGHECILGTRAIFLPGRAVPNRTMIVMRPEEGVIKLPSKADKSVPHVYHEGRILPLGEVLPDWKPLEIDP